MKSALRMIIPYQFLTHVTVHMHVHPADTYTPTSKINKLTTYVLMEKHAFGGHGRVSWRRRV